jgi:antitoxin component YwqK of YwqJK toxin-antitoxin module
MKKILVLFVLLSSFHFFAQEKIYYTEDFRELPNKNGATYYSTYEKIKDGIQRKTYFLDGLIRNSDQFSNLKRKIRNGTSETWYNSGSKKTVALYIKDKLEGIQTGYYENGSVKRIENFENNKFIDGKCFDENGTEITFFEYYVKPKFPGGINEFYKYVAKNFKSPNSAKGKIKIAFVVETDGSLKDFKITEGLNYDMNVEALRILFNSPLWIPGKLDGEDAPVTFSLPITIR